MKTIKAFATFLFLATAFSASALLPGGGGGGVTNVNNRVMYSNSLVNYFPATGGSATFNIAGYTQPNTFSNQIVVLLDTNQIFLSPETTGQGQRWSLSGTLQFDGTNMNSFVTLVSDDPSNYFTSATAVITNANYTNPVFSVQQAYDTNTFGTNFGGYYYGYSPTNANQNLVIFSGSLMAGTVVPPLLDPANCVFGDVHTPSLSDVTNIAMSVGGGGGGATVAVTNTLTGAPGSSIVVTNLGSSTVGVFQFTFPPLPTNTITVMNFSNQVLSSQQILVYSTNNIVWGTSNYIGTVPGLYSLSFLGGYLGPGGTSLPTNVTQNVYASTNGDVSWFLICSNGGICTFTTTNSVDLSVSGAGGGQGYLQVYYVDYPALINRTNGHFGQVDLYDDPTQPQQAATKNYVDAQIANANASLFLTSTDTNNVRHYTYSAGGNKIFDMANQQVYIGIGYARSGTNLIVLANQTNLSTGYTMLLSTNLSLPNYGFSTFTNILGISTNAGIVSFTNAINPNAANSFYRILSSSSSSSSFYTPLYALSATTNCIILADTNGSGHLLGIYASTNGGSPTLYIHGSGTSRLLGDQDEHWLLWLLTGVSFGVAVFSVAHTRWHVRRHLRKP